MQNTNGLQDSFGRKHNYLRISLTDKCNFRCTYCMPSEHMKFMPSANLMSTEEVIGLASIFRDLGIGKIRLTGGEPTLRRDLQEIVRGLSKLDVKLLLTTNGADLAKHLDGFWNSGLKNLNISLDTLREDKFLRITQRNALANVMDNISLAVKRGFKVKVNVVVIRDFNDDEIVDLLEWATEKSVELRFIEYMPFLDNAWTYEKVFTEKEVLEKVATRWKIEKNVSPPDSTSASYHLPELGSRFGIIPTISNPFCSGCSRIRLTADGKVRNCLFSNDETDLLTAFRSGLDVSDLVRATVYRKKAVAAGKIDFKNVQAGVEYAKNRAMVAIGG